MPLKSMTVMNKDEAHRIQQKELASWCCRVLLGFAWFFCWFHFDLSSRSPSCALSHPFWVGRVALLKLTTEKKLVPLF